MRQISHSRLPAALSLVGALAAGAVGPAALVAQQPATDGARPGRTEILWDTWGVCRDRAALSPSGTCGAGRDGVGARRARDAASTALQHVVAERGVASRRRQARVGRLRQ